MRLVGLARVSKGPPFGTNLRTEPVWFCVHICRAYARAFPKGARLHWSCIRLLMVAARLHLAHRLGAAALMRPRLYLQLLRRWQSKNANDLFGIHDAAANHVLAIVANSLDDQFPLRHLLKQPPVSDILYVAVNNVEFVRFEVGGRCRFQLLSEARTIEQRRLGHAEHLSQMPQ